MILSDFGAEVIKVESFDGDETRQWGPPYLNEQSTYFLSINRNKKSICIDLKKGQELIYELAKISDIFIENFSSGVTKKLGLDYNTMASINPKLIYASINGFGNTGNQKMDPGFDYIVQAQSGLMHITGEKNGPPLKVGVAIVDVLTALHVTNGIQAALYSRQETGKGSLIETSLYESAISSLANVSSMYTNAQIDMHRMGNMHPSIAPYGTFKIGHEFIVIGVAQDNQFRGLCQVLGNDKLKEEQFSKNKGRIKNREELQKIIEESLIGWNVEELVQKLKEVKVPVGKVQSVGESLDSLQCQQLEMVNQIENEKHIRSPLSVNREHLVKNMSRAPLLNEHRDYVLSLIQRDDSNELIRKGILKQ